MSCCMPFYNIFIFLQYRVDIYFFVLIFIYDCFLIGRTLGITVFISFFLKIYEVKIVRITTKN